MAYAIRRIEPGEWRQLRALRLEALSKEPTAFGIRYADAAALADEDWRQQAEEHATFVATVEDGGWVGMAGIAPLERFPGTVCVHSVYVTSAHRGGAAKLAARLMDSAITWAAENTDAARLTLGVHEDNQRAQAFYRRIGFTDTGMVVPYNLDPAKRLFILGYEGFRQGLAE
ncbi:RimJ/RimL family protein N-acetyltransferase [Hamadaea flava]|uniref:GNAT family N-acetyltransferase n=1 Tax=Hamadaea flava TaxID=1742688 RepID=A0ABV8LXA8_9ACTN|nr:GNAT family N-acetyltransferase [Hamadaea flava]MCP2326977.1 RimJ/RimL family protein N-acetyltransferase [Hamadaea flava]